MKISTKGRYALRLMLDLAIQPGDSAVPLRDVAERQEISDKYLEQIVTQLARGGLVRSVRGAGGGYLLTRTPEEYTVGNILRQLEGNPRNQEARHDKVRLEKFFRSQWYGVLTELDPERLMAGVKENVQHEMNERRRKKAEKLRRKAELRGS